MIINAKSPNKHSTSVAFTIKRPACEELLCTLENGSKKILPTLKSQHRPSFLHVKKPP